MRLLERLRDRSARRAFSPRHPQAPKRIRARKDKAALVRAGTESNPRTTRADLDGPPATKTKPRYSSLDRVNAARAQRNEREQLRDEARYRRERLELYKARLYAGRARDQNKLRELQRAADGAAARARRAEAGASADRPPA